MLRLVNPSRIRRFQRVAAILSECRTQPLPTGRRVRQQVHNPPRSLESTPNVPAHLAQRRQFCMQVRVLRRGVCRPFAELTGPDEEGRLRRV